MVNTRVFRLAADLQQAFEVGGVGGKRAVGSDDGYDACGGKFGQGAEGLQEAAAVYPDAFWRALAQGVAFAGRADQDGFCLAQGADAGVSQCRCR